MSEAGRSTTSYADAGVSIERGAELVERIKGYAKRTHRTGVLGGIGGFASLFELQQAGYRNPVLVSGTDGVGTKIKLAQDAGRHDRIGIDLVAMCVNDLVVQGAEPLFFLDYYACGKLDVDVAERVIAGIASGCSIAGCALVGGETAEMPGMYQPGDYDLAGFVVGIVEKDQIIDGRTVVAGDLLIGLGSSGPHSNGYSLIRKLLKETGTQLSDRFGEKTFADILLEPTRIYVQTILELARVVDIKAAAHITGGGIPENLPRVLPSGIGAEIRQSSWPRPPIFSWLQRAGNVEDQEMLKTFNCGIGMVLAVDPANASRTVEFLESRGEPAWIIGEVKEYRHGQPRVSIAAGPAP